MVLEEEGEELRPWRTVSVAALRAPSTAVPHFPQNSLSGGTAVAHDGQSLNWLSSPALLIYRERLLPRLYNGTSRVGGFWRMENKHLDEWKLISNRLISRD
jgi:hypothetical protein